MPWHTAAIFYTSGTTGRPKGVPLSHRNLRFNMDGLLASGLLTPDERLLVPLPLYHVYPFMAAMLAPLAAGSTLIFPAGISGPEIVAALAEERATAIVGVPRLYRALADAIRAGTAARGRLVGSAFKGMLHLAIALRRGLGFNLGGALFASIRRRIAPELRTLASGGAPLDPEVARTLEGLGWEVLSGYGLTETSPIVSFNRRGRSRIESTGLVLAGVEVRIEGADESGLGEVQVRGPSVFAGYFNNAEATTIAFTADGWFRTGDLGRFDPEGYLYIGARGSERIVLSDGKNVWPEEVEDIYAESSMIEEVAVLEIAGDLVALVRPDLKAMRDAGATDIDEALRGEMRARSPALAPFKRVTDFAVIRDGLPRTPLGKLRRFELAGLYEAVRTKGGARRPQVLSEADRTLLEIAAARHVWDLLERKFPERNLSLDADPRLDLGIGSLEWVNLGLELQEDIGAQLTEDGLAEIVTVRDLLHEVVAATERAAARATAPLAPAGLGPEQLRWLEPGGLGLVLLAAALFGLNRLIFRLLFRLRAEGSAHVPEDGPVIVAPNHVSYLDSFAIAAALPLAQIRRGNWGGITAILFSNRLVRFFSRIAGVFPVDPDRGPASSLALGTKVLRRRRILFWYPEGARSPDGELKRFLPGIGIVARETGAKCLPVLIEGTYEAWSIDRRFPRLGRVVVRFGEPIAAAELEALGSGETPEERIANALHDAVAGLGPRGNGQAAGSG